MKSNMGRARKAKNDELYTKYETVEKELINYKIQLENKIVYCNCDDYRVSNFYKYFKDNFESLKLKQLIATNYDIGSGSFKCAFDGKSEKVTRLSGNGDFSSGECIELLEFSDIVITNPPFSLFRDFIATLVEYDKRFLIIGNFNAVTYEGVFPLIKDDRLWLGYNAPKNFSQPDGGEKNFGNITWFTNLTTKKRLDFIPLSKSYYDNIDEYPKYDNYNAINVDRTNEIPKDYEGIMGVPITFLNIFNPNQFEILGMSKTPICYDNSTEAKRTKIYENVTRHSKNGKTSSGNEVNTAPTLLLNNPPKNKTYYTTNSIEGYLIALYARILIKNRKGLIGSE